MSCAVCELYYAVKHLRLNIFSAENPTLFLTVHFSFSFFVANQSNSSVFLMESGCKQCVLCNTFICKITSL